MLRVLKRTRTLRFPVVLESPRHQALQPSFLQLYLKPIFISSTLTITSFTLAALVHEREAERFWKQLRVERPEWANLRHIVTNEQLLMLDLWHEKAKLWKERQEKALKELKQRLEAYKIMPVWIKNTVYTCTQSYFNLPEAQKTITGLMGINTLVFLCWRIPPLRPTMQRYFTMQHLNMLTSCFSHRNILHWTVNMVALYTFGPMVYEVLGREQFLACYVSFGINANLIGYLLKRPVALNLGANGAIYGLLASAAFLYPDTSLFIPFLPTFPIPINYAIPALVTMDIAGVLLRWRMFNHFTHLGGAVLGLGYMKYGPEYIWQPLLKKIRELKGSGSSRGDGSNIMMEIPNKKLVSWLKKTSTVPEKQ